MNKEKLLCQAVELLGAITLSVCNPSQQTDRWCGQIHMHNL